jgi:hypothetical protein
VIQPDQLYLDVDHSGFQMRFYTGYKTMWSPLAQSVLCCSVVGKVRVGETVWFPSVPSHKFSSLNTMLDEVE